jgi:ATP-binding cassette, subfamily B, bacterial
MIQGGGGAMRGPVQSIGGLPRSFGLQDHFSKPEDNPRARPTSQQIKRIFGYFKPYWREWLAILLCIAGSSALAVAPPFCVSVILDSAIPKGESELLAWMALAMVGLAVVTGLMGVLEQSLTARAGQSIMCDLRNELFRHLQNMSLHFYTATRSGEIVSRLNNDVNAVQGVASRTLVAIVSNLLTLAFTVVALLMMNWQLALLAVMVVPFFYLPSLAVGKVRRRLAAETQASQSRLLSFMQERLNVSGALLTKIFGQGNADAEEFRGRNAEIRDLNIRQTVVGRWLFMVLSVFSVVGPALIYWYGGLQVIEKNLTVGQLIAFAALLTLLYRPLMQLATVYVDIQASVAVFDRIFEYLDMQPSVSDKQQPKEFARVKGRIEFRNVSFTYPTPPAVSDTPAPTGTTEEAEVKPPFA